MKSLFVDKRFRELVRQIGLGNFEFFARLEPWQWPAPTPAELAQIAVAGGNTEASPYAAVKLVWDCARVHREALMYLGELRKSSGRRDEDMRQLLATWNLADLRLPCDHKSFLQRLNLGPILVDTASPVQGPDLWMAFLKKLPTWGLGDPEDAEVFWPQFSSKENIVSAEAWNAEKEYEGWSDFEMLRWFVEKFREWREQCVSRNKRKGQQAGAKGIRKKRQREKNRKNI